MSGATTSPAAPDQWIVDFETERELINWTREKEINERRCIYRVPQLVKQLRPDSFTPRAVSLGPYHHGASHLKNVEKTKRKILGCFLAKINKNAYAAMQAMRRDVQELMDAYADLDDSWRTDVDSFVRMMVLDGCFLLGFEYFRSDLLSGLRRDDDPWYCCYAWDIGNVVFSVDLDIVLLENQVPRLALSIMEDLGGDRVPRNNEQREGLHLLHSFWLKWKVQSDFLFKSPLDREVNPPTVTELVEAGIQIEKCTDMTVRFENGVLKLPAFAFEQKMIIGFRNSIAFEAMHKLDPEFYSFADFMDCLVSSARDLEILRKKGVIRVGIASDQDVADFFKNLTRKLYYPARRYRVQGDDVAKLLVDYCRKWHNRWPASFKRLYLHNPWTFISLLGALFLLVLTVLSTVYTMLDYHHK